MTGGPSATLARRSETGSRLTPSDVRTTWRGKTHRNASPSCSEIVVNLEIGPKRRSPGKSPNPIDYWYTQQSWHSMPLLEARDSGLYCPAGDFYIDPAAPVDRAVITHAHSIMPAPARSDISPRGEAKPSFAPASDRNAPFSRSPSGSRSRSATLRSASIRPDTSSGRRKCGWSMWAKCGWSREITSWRPI